MVGPEIPDGNPNSFEIGMYTQAASGSWSRLLNTHDVQGPYLDITDQTKKQIDSCVENFLGSCTSGLIFFIKLNILYVKLLGIMNIHQGILPKVVKSHFWKYAVFKVMSPVPPHLK